MNRSDAVALTTLAHIGAALWRRNGRPPTLPEVVTEAARRGQVADDEARVARYWATVHNSHDTLCDWPIIRAGAARRRGAHL